MGCGCNKKSPQVAGASAPARRATVYQVMSNNAVIAEFETLQEARSEATKVGGRVKVTSKLVV